MSSIYYCKLDPSTCKDYDWSTFTAIYAYTLKRGNNISVSKTNQELIVCKNRNQNHTQPYTNNGITCVIDAFEFIHPQSVINLIQTYGIPNFTKYINSYYVILVKTNGNTYIFRDPSGSKPLYIAYNSNPRYVLICSELKSIPPLKETNIYTFPSGHYWSTNNYSFINLPPNNNPKLINLPITLDNIILVNGDIPSLILFFSLTDNNNRYFNLHYIPSDSITPNPNLEYSKIMAKTLNFNINIIEFNLTDILNCISNVIYCLETYDRQIISTAIPIWIFLLKISTSSKHFLLHTTHGYTHGFTTHAKTNLMLDKICSYFNCTPSLLFYTDNKRKDIKEIALMKYPTKDSKKLENSIPQIIGRSPDDYSEVWIKDLIKNIPSDKTLQEYYKEIYYKHFKHPKGKLN